MKILTFCLILLSPYFLFAQNAVNIQAIQVNDQIKITYQLPNTTSAHRFDIHIFCKLSENDSFELKKISGDFGHEIRGGKATYTVLWDVFEEVDEFSAARFYVVAELLNAEEFVLSETDSVKLKQEITNQKIITQAKSDAKTYYKNNRTLWGTGCTTFIFIPIGALMATISSLTPPDEKHLNMPQGKYSNLPLYQETYANEAHRIKKRRVWITFGIIAIPQLILTTVSLF